MNSRQKGKRGELELSHYLTERGFPARRTQQYAGTGGTSDITCQTLEGFHVEAKRTEKLQLREAMEQAVRDSNGEKVPLVCHRSNRTEWLATLRLEDLLSLLRTANGGGQNVQ